MQRHYLHVEIENKKYNIFIISYQESNTHCAVLIPSREFDMYDLQNYNGDDFTELPEEIQIKIEKDLYPTILSGFVVHGE